MISFTCAKPKISFKIDIKFDKWKINEFLNREWRRDQFRKIIFRAHPELEQTIKFSKLKREKFINNYIDQKYKENFKNYKDFVTFAKKEWSKVEKDFFQEANKIFKNTPWPKGEYVGFFTISPPMPRFLDTKIFQFGKDKNDRWKQTVAHEMLHFIFYEFVREKYAPKLKNTIEGDMNKALEGKLKIPLWDLSEVLNVVLLNSSNFQKLFPFESFPYPGHEDYHKECLTLWNKTKGNIDLFLQNLEVLK